MTLNAKVTNSGFELSDCNIKSKLINCVKYTLADTPLRLTDVNLTEPKPPETEGHEYGYAIFKLLSNINISA